MENPSRVCYQLTLLSLSNGAIRLSAVEHVLLRRCEAQCKTSRRHLSPTSAASNLFLPRFARGLTLGIAIAPYRSIRRSHGKATSGHHHRTVRQMPHGSSIAPLSDNITDSVQTRSKARCSRQTMDIRLTHTLRPAPHLRRVDPVPSLGGANRTRPRRTRGSVTRTLSISGAEERSSSYDALERYRKWQPQ